MIAQSTMDQESVAILREYVQELMRYVVHAPFSHPFAQPEKSKLLTIFPMYSYMVQERSRIFQQEYETATTQYQNLSRS